MSDNLTDRHQYVCKIEGNFNLVTRLLVDIRLFKAVSRFSSNNYIKQIELISYPIADDKMDFLHEKLTLVTCELLVTDGYEEINTTKLVDML